MNNISELIIGKETHLNHEIIENIENHCYSNKIVTVIQNIKNNSHESMTDWDPDFLIFNYISEYIKTRFPTILESKTPEEKLDIIYEAIPVFLDNRGRKEQIYRFLINIKNNNDKQESQKTKIIKNKFVNQLLSVFM